MTLVCRSDRYTPSADTFEDAEAFFAMCDAVGFDRPSLRERGGDLYEGDELVLEVVPPRFAVFADGTWSGNFTAWSESDALDAYARDAGYRSWADACTVAPTHDGEMLVAAIDDGLTVAVRDDVYTVTDSAGGVWWPGDSAQADITAAGDSEAATLAICAADPTRGVWRT